MSLWAPSSLLLLSVAFMAMMHPGCSATDPLVLDASIPRITSTRDLRTFSSNLTKNLHKIEHALAPLREHSSELERQYKQHSSRTARHGWHSARERQLNTRQLFEDARAFRSEVQPLHREFQQALGRQLNFIQSRKVRRFRDQSVSQQIAQSAKVYKRIIDLLVNMIDCPIFIMEHLGGGGGGGGSGSDGGDYMPDGDYGSDDGGDDGGSYPTGDDTYYDGGFGK